MAKRGLGQNLRVFPSQHSFLWHKNRREAEDGQHAADAHRAVRFAPCVRAPRSSARMVDSSGLLTPERNAASAVHVPDK